MKILFVILLVGVSSVSWSQNKWWKSKNVDLKADEEEEQSTDTIRYVNEIDTNNIRPGEVHVIKSPMVDKIIEFKAANISPYVRPTMKGYRVQLFFDQNRDQVDKARSQLLAKDNEISIYVEYHAPNYYLLVGDYRSHLDAEKLRAEMIEDFPAAIVKESRIYLPKIDEKKVVE